MQTFRIIPTASVCALLLLAAGPAALAQFELVRSRVAGGGALASTGGGFEVSGTIGQPDAQLPPVMSGGGFSLSGGYWPAAETCFCPGDMNGDAKKDGLDVQRFVECVVSGGNCSCADVDSVGGVNLADVSVFVIDLLNGGTCSS